MDKKFFQTWSKRTGKSVKELEEVWKEIEKDNKGLPERVLKIQFGKRIRGKIFSERQGKTRREPVEFLGFILGCGRLRDYLDYLRREALKAWNEDKDGAILSGLVDEAGTPLDRRETIKRFGREIENPNYGKPLVGHEYSREIFGIAKMNNEGVPRLFRMRLFRKAAETFKYRPFVPVRFLALVRETKSPLLELNASRRTVFKVVKEDIDIEGWIREALGDRMYYLDTLDKAVENTAYAIDPWILIEGDVDYIDPEVIQKTGSRRIVLTDAEKGIPDTVQVFLPEDFPLAFKEYSRVLVFGRPKKWRRLDEEEERYFIEGISAYPIPEFTVEEEIEVGRSAMGDSEMVIVWEE